MKQTIICIAGGSGVGKTYAANKLRELFTTNGHACKVICSCTTRPMREGEQQGIEHKFVADLSDYYADKNNDNVLADTVYGGHTYWASAADLIDGINLYVIDEAGIESLRTYAKRHTSIRLFTVKLIAKPSVIAARGIDNERLARDPELKLSYDLTSRNDEPTDVYGLYSVIKLKLGIYDTDMTFCIEQDNDSPVTMYNIQMYNDKSNYACTSTRRMTMTDLRRLHDVLGKFLDNVKLQ